MGFQLIDQARPATGRAWGGLRLPWPVLYTVLVATRLCPGGCSGPSSSVPTVVNGACAAPADDCRRAPLAGDLLFAEDAHRLDLAGACGGNQCCQRSNGKNDPDNAGESEGVRGRNTVQHARQQASESGRQRQAARSEERRVGKEGRVRRAQDPSTRKG